MKRILLVIIMSAILYGTADAQRLLPRQGGIEMYGGLPVQKKGMFSEGSFAAGFQYMKYVKHYHYYHFGAEYAMQNYRYGKVMVPVMDCTAEGGFSFHLFSTPGKSILVYAGAYAVLGYEEVNGGERRMPDGALLNARNRFVYGGGVRLSLEGFVTDNIVLFARAKGHFLGGTDLDLFRPALNFGIRITM